jgi:transcription antitermination factor NusG
MNTADSRASWYALYVRPNYEIAVASRLRSLGVEEYVPLRKAAVPAGRNKPLSRSPLFPGYVFSFLNLQSGPKLYSIPGVLRVLGFGGQAMPLEDEEIAMVRAVVNSSLPTEPVPYLRAGDKVYLSSGPLTGVSGTVVRTLGETRLVLSLPLLKRSLAVTVPAEWVTTELSRALAS